jgi:exodeoxyribonuclease V alpha subunit
MKQHLFDDPELLKCSLPEDGEQLIRFIANEKDFRGIGESKARALWSHLGKRLHATLSIDTYESRDTLRDVLSDDSISALFEGYKKYKTLRYVNWMTMRGIPASIQQRLLKHHDVKTIDAIQQNPYLLIGFGMSFADVDALVSAKRFEVVNNPSFTIKIDDDKRLSAALEMAIRKEIDKGHTYTTAQEIKPTLFIGRKSV